MSLPLRFYREVASEGAMRFTNLLFSTTYVRLRPWRGASLAAESGVTGGDVWSSRSSQADFASETHSRSRSPAAVGGAGRQRRQGQVSNAVLSVTAADDTPSLLRYRRTSFVSVSVTFSVYSTLVVAAAKTQ